MPLRVIQNDRCSDGVSLTPVVAEVTQKFTKRKCALAPTGIYPEENDRFADDPKLFCILFLCVKRERLGTNNQLQ